MTDKLEPIELCKRLLDHISKEVSFVHSPKLVTRGDIDLSKFEKQESGLVFAPVEYVNQTSGGGITGDEFSGTMAWPVTHLYLLVVEYHC